MLYKDLLLPNGNLMWSKRKPCLKYSGSVLLPTQFKIQQKVNQTMTRSHHQMPASLKASMSGGVRSRWNLKSYTLELVVNLNLQQNMCSWFHWLVWSDSNNETSHVGASPSDLCAPRRSDLIMSVTRRSLSPTCTCGMFQLEHCSKLNIFQDRESTQETFGNYK